MGGGPGGRRAQAAGWVAGAVRVQALPPQALMEGEQVRDQHFLALVPVPEQVGLAREFVRVHTGFLAEDDADTVVLLTSELVSNAVIHARTALRVGVTATAATIVVTVHDLDLGHRELLSTAPRDGGRGLVLVEALASAWAVHRHRGGGKTVWFRVQHTALRGCPGPAGACGDPSPPASRPEPHGTEQEGER